jgi:hypothetical protein
MTRADRLSRPLGPPCLCGPCRALSQALDRHLAAVGHARATRQQVRAAGAAVDQAHSLDGRPQSGRHRDDGGTAARADDRADHSTIRPRRRSIT